MKAAREARDVDQKAIAKAIGASESAVSRWENGESIPKDQWLLKLAHYFGVTPAWLRYGQEPREEDRAPVAPATRVTQSKRKQG